MQQGSDVHTKRFLLVVAINVYQCAFNLTVFVMQPTQDMKSNLWSEKARQFFSKFDRVSSVLNDTIIWIEMSCWEQSAWYCQLLKMLVYAVNPEPPTLQSTPRKYSLYYRLIACDVMAAMLVVWNNNNFSPLGVNFHFYANYVSKFSFVFTTNMASMQSTYTLCSGSSYTKFWKDQGGLYLRLFGRF